jgi:IS5 family transposase
MLGRRQRHEPKLFYTGFNLAERISPEHPLRAVSAAVDFSFVRREVASLYGRCGHESVDPIVILKLLFLLFYEDIKSERALMRDLRHRMDWLWFCGYDLDDATPDHSVLSKARRRWGSEVFSAFFQRVLEQCVDAGLVDGETIHVDSSLIHGNVAKERLGPELRRIGQRLYGELEETSDPAAEACEADGEGGSPESDEEPEALEQRVSPTDPDARLTKKYGESVLGYKDSRAVDDQVGVITTTVTTAANVNDSKLLDAVVCDHGSRSGTEAKTVVADKGYGVLENYKDLHEKGMTACIPHQSYSPNGGKLSPEKFRYDPERDVYVCPAGQILTRYDHQRPHGKTYRYRAPREVCQACRFFGECVASTTRGRQIGRHADIEHMEWADHCLPKHERRRLLARRKYKAEGSFADATINHGYKRARWRGLEKVTIQNLLIATIQNLRKLLRYAHRHADSPAMAVILPRFGPPSLHRWAKCFRDATWAARNAIRRYFPEKRRAILVTG